VGASGRKQAKGLYQWSPVDSNDELEPRLDLKFQVGVPEHLEAKGAIAIPLGRLFAIQAGQIAIERVEHDGACFFSADLRRVV
jgi:hypothetical protein